MPYNTFVENARRGRTGEVYVRTHINDLCSAGTLEADDRATERVEGGDLYTQRVTWENEANNIFPNYVYEYAPELQNLRAYRPEYTIGGVEVKTSWDFLFQTNDHEAETGTLHIALWSSNTRDKPGWLPKLLNPNRFTRQDDAPAAVQPHTLLFILAAYENVFAAIAFENVPEFLNRLRFLAQEIGIDLDNEIPYGDDAQAWSPTGMLLTDATWLVPLKDIEDLARVTMIGDMPRLRPDIRNQWRSCSRNTQQQRYAHLTELSNGRHISIEAEYRNAFTPSSDRQIFADINYNLDVIEHINSEHYPTLASLSGQRALEHLNGIMLYMLAQEFPVWPERNKRFFLIGKRMLECWCKEFGIIGSTKSWQGSLVFLSDCGLIKCFRPTSDIGANGLNRVYQSIKPINGKRPSLRSVPRYTDRVLAQAEHVAQIYHQNKIVLSKMTKADVIRCRGQEIANKLYLDGRTISEEELYVHDLYMRTMVTYISQSGYALKVQILDTVERTMVREQQFQCIDTFGQYSDAEIAELNRQKPFWRAFEKMKERTRQLANEAGYNYCPISRRNRQDLHLPDDLTQWIIC